MIVLVTGSRHPSAQLKRAVFQALDEIHAETPITLLISGACVNRETGELSGADRYGIEWAISREVDFNGRPARWRVEGHPQAGPMRNGRMVRELDSLCQLRSGRSERGICLAFEGGTGTQNCKRQARAFSVEVREVAS